MATEGKTPANAIKAWNDTDKKWEYIVPENTIVPKPILCISRVGYLSSDQLRAFQINFQSLHRCGWLVIILENMPENNVQAFMPNGGNIETLDISLFGEWLKTKT